MIFVIKLGAQQANLTPGQLGYYSQRHRILNLTGLIIVIRNVLITFASGRRKPLEAMSGFMVVLWYHNEQNGSPLDSNI